MLKELDEETFHAHVMEYSGFVLVCFFAKWAAPSVDMVSRLEDIKKVPTYSVDLEAYPRLGLLVTAKAAPTSVLFLGGEIISYKVGLMTETDVRKWLSEFI